MTLTEIHKTIMDAQVALRALTKALDFSAEHQRRAGFKAVADSISETSAMANTLNVKLIREREFHGAISVVEIIQGIEGEIIKTETETVEAVRSSNALMAQRQTETLAAKEPKQPPSVFDKLLSPGDGHTWTVRNRMAQGAVSEIQRIGATNAKQAERIVSKVWNRATPQDKNEWKSMEQFVASVADLIVIPGFRGTVKGVYR